MEARFEGNSLPNNYGNSAPEVKYPGEKLLRVLVSSLEVDCFPDL